MTTYFAEFAQLPDGLARNVRLEIDGGSFTSVLAGAPADGAVRLPGVTLPGFANAHSHAFHRALRGRTHDEGGSFWTWRERMYDLAGRLDPDTYYELARATYAEMVAAGFTTVGEFHYLHHGPLGVAYADANVMGDAVLAAAADAGIRITLLDTCYLAGGLTGDGHSALDPVQRRFADRSVDDWESRASALRDGDKRRIGAAIHSVRAVPESAIPVVAAAAAGRPLHAHVSEQLAENQVCQSFYGRTPTGVFADGGALTPHFVAVHATHVSAGDIAQLGAQTATVCMCPTTERDLADGIGPTAAFREAGLRVSLGTDQHAAIDPFEEARGLEMNERLATMARGRNTPGELLDALCNHAAIGWPDVGRLEAGFRADLVAIDTESVRTAGGDPGQVLLSAGSPDVHTVIVDGEPVVTESEHRSGPVGALLAAAITSAWKGDG